MPATTTPFRYRGVVYRTPLDAKWAALFHHLRAVEAQYDPYALGVGGPTFLVRGEQGEATLVTVDHETRDVLWEGGEVGWRVGLLPPDEPSWLGLPFAVVDYAWAKATNDITGLHGQQR